MKRSGDGAALDKKESARERDGFLDFTARLRGGQDFLTAAMRAGLNHR